ncbi:ribonuclease R [Ferrovum sp. JA12]|uniref:ribonuclease catalytic domain-containing protein n=1 Tax=Ferrovum sp. JA12 TaxID=1356299 RepID=UPI0007034CDB|nr:ribonuclease catalytic domain-containing protein [Ferrovum sp. JA12]KRH79453.1 ribonuclease R [Ferrovum sp. JA12]
MNVFYEDEGELRVATILTPSESSLMVETPFGKRVKIKRQAVIFEFEFTPLEQFLAQAKELQKELDVQLLWEVSTTGDTIDVKELGKEYLGRLPNSLELASFYLALFHAPIYFYKRGRGQFRRASDENLKAALFGLEKKRLQEEQKQLSLHQIQQGDTPDWLKSHYQTILYKPDKNTWEYKTAEFIANELNMSLPELVTFCGLLSDSHEFFTQKFIHDHIIPEISLPAFDKEKILQPLPEATVLGFSIDDAFTTEIDDAFSLTEHDQYHWQVGIHIAIPALGIDPDSPLSQYARQRLSTVYMPGNKIAMLPQVVIDCFSLKEKNWNPCLSCYLTVDKQSFEITDRITKIEKIWIEDNLRLHELQPYFLEGDVVAQHPYQHPLQILLYFARKIASNRGVNDRPQTQYIDYDFVVTEDRISITQRPRGSSLDTLVAELMIEVNSHWAQLLAESELTGLFRVQENGKTYMSTEAKAHKGLGLKRYAWTSSPLRRYVDLVNQWQLLNLINNRLENCFINSNEFTDINRSFDVTYGIYLDFQRMMEKYWSLRWLLQENIIQWQATALRETNVRLKGLPLVLSVKGVDKLVLGEIYSIKISAIDLWQLTCQCELVQ